ncbi:MAG: DNA sulfur modification protein DndD [Tissierellia bacterium]|nr:DNA sulfur modification protein DndD [Tissierellia bacterium]
MLIKYIKVHNFGVYSGTHTVDLSITDKEKPIILIGGLNGRGKTTLLEAITLALYGNNSFNFIESGLSYQNYLSKYVNKNDGSLEAFVEISFDISQNDISTNYIIRRQWNLKTKNINEKIIIFKNGISNPSLTKYWRTFVEDIMPSSVARFSIFDGEKITQYFSDNSDEQVKLAIKTFLGLDVIDRIIDDLKRIVKQHHIKDKKYFEESQEMVNLKEKIDIINNEIQSNTQEIAHLTSLMTQNKEKLRKAEESFYKSGGVITDERNQIAYKRENLIKEKNELFEQLLEIAAGELPLVLTLPLLREIYTSVKKENENRINAIAMQKIIDLRDDLKRLFTGDKAVTEKLNNYFESISTQVEDFNPVFNLSSTAFEQLSYLYKERLVNKANSVKAMLEQYKKIESEISELDLLLSMEMDTNTADKLLEMIKTLTKDITICEEGIEKYNQENERLSKELAIAEHELLKLTELALGKIEEQDDAIRVVRYANLSIDVMKEYRERLKMLKIDTISNTITDCFHAIIGKNSLVERIEIEPKTLNVIMINNDNEVLLKSKVSAGELQIYYISILWALSICANKQFPVIIDTPLARLDTKHRFKMIKNYLPMASDQTIVFSTDSEIVNEYYYEISKYVSQKYLLYFDEDTQSTKIEKGYFKEVNL